MKLQLMASDFEEEWISFKVPHDIFMQMGFSPMKLEVDITPLLARASERSEQLASTEQPHDAIALLDQWLKWGHSVKSNVVASPELVHQTRAVVAQQHHT